MIKRTWIVTVAALALLVLLSACDGGRLAGDLTPIPTLPPGDEPELVEAIREGVAEPTDAGEDGEALDEDALVSRGDELFAANCAGCHPPAGGAGPAFEGMGERAANRVDGQSAADYLHESIVDPHAFLVPGFQVPMPAFDELSETELDALVAYILAESGGPAADDEVAEDGDDAAAEDADADEEAADEVGAADVPAAEDVGDPDAGETLFVETCRGCHQDQRGAGPPLPGMGERAATEVPGMTAVAYLHESIVDPSAHVVEGYSDIMPKTYEDMLTEDEINNLVAYLLTK